MIAKCAKFVCWNKLSNEWMINAFKNRYMYNFECLGRPIIQTPVDMVAIQEIIWKVKPDLTRSLLPLGNFISEGALPRYG